MSWNLTVATKNGEHLIRLKGDEAEAIEALKDAQGYIGKTGTVTISDRLSLPAESITSVKIHESWP